MGRAPALAGLVGAGERSLPGEDAHGFRVKVQKLGHLFYRCVWAPRENCHAPEATTECSRLQLLLQVPPVSISSYLKLVQDEIELHTPATKLAFLPI